MLRSHNAQLANRTAGPAVGTSSGRPARSGLDNRRVRVPRWCPTIGATYVRNLPSLLMRDQAVPLDRVAVAWSGFRTEAVHELVLAAPPPRQLLRGAAVPDQALVGL